MSIQEPPMKAAYECKCGYEFWVVWAKRPWFGDYNKPCKKCKKQVWPSSSTHWSVKRPYMGEGLD